jgi:hypothetical protein
MVCKPFADWLTGRHGRAQVCSFEVALGGQIAAFYKKGTCNRYIKWQKGLVVVIVRQLTGV